MAKVCKNITLAVLCLFFIFMQAGCQIDTDDSKAMASASPSAPAVPEETKKADGSAGDSSNNDSPQFLESTAEPVKNTGIDVTRIDGLSGDFICGADISSIKSEYESGARYYDFNGRELFYAPGEGQKGFFSFLKECGINWVRIRVWNDPYDEEGNGYGGGNNDLEAAKEIGKLATDAGLRVLIDFHYSDFWADPGKYQAPKEWADMDIDRKMEALEVYTAESLISLIDYGVDVGMVQVGNETVTGLAGETGWDNICKLMNEGSRAVRYVADTMEKEILVALHFTNISMEWYDTIAATLKENQVDYDVFATSYYPYWHGTVENLAEVLGMVAEKYGKKVMVAETAYVYTLKDGDGHRQSIDKKEMLPKEYKSSVQGQADAIADVIKAAASVGEAGIGVFYWEPAWIPVQVYNKNSKNSKEVLKENKKIWEERGSGWASSYAGSYDAQDAGRWYGGSSWDNQALFDFKGHPLQSACIFKYVFTGAVKGD